MHESFLITVPKLRIKKKLFVTVLSGVEMGKYTGMGHEKGSEWYAREGKGE